MWVRAIPAGADPRWFQIGALSLLLAYGVVGSEIGVDCKIVLTTIGVGLVVQAFAVLMLRLPFDMRSAWITCLSLTLLLRTYDPATAALAAFAAIGSKFVLRWRGRHFFNPANFGIVVALVSTDQAWVSAGQWGSGPWLGFALLCLGTVVVTRAVRADITFGFLAAYSGMLLARAQWLGDPWAIPLHQLQSGALLIFAFFMISDPKTSPQRRWARLVYATVVAAGAMFVHFGLYRPNGLIWALVCCAPLVPFLDRLGDRVADRKDEGEGNEHSTIALGLGGLPRLDDGAGLGVLRVLRR